MKNMLTEQELFREVERAVCSAFRVSGSLGPNTRFVGDLGAESIDFLDLSYDLEKIVEVEVDLRKLFEAKRSQHAELDITIQELVNYLMDAKAGQAA